MKYGELKIECMAVMDELNEAITMDNLANFEVDESYQDLFLRMPGSINRAMDRMANRKKLPLMSSVLENGQEEGSFIVFDLSGIERYRNIKRLSYTDAITYIPSIDYIVEGTTLMIPREYKNGTLRVVFYPSAPAISSTTENTTEIDIPDELARIIPYYVKSDLMSRDEPTLATLARNKFESALDEFNFEKEDSFGLTIEKVYRID